MKKINHLRDHLFANMEALANCNPEDLEQEIKRSKALAEVASVIVDTAKVEVSFFAALPTSSKHDAQAEFFKPLPQGLTPEKTTSDE